MIVAEANPSSSDGLRGANVNSLRFSPDTVDQIGVLVVQHVGRPMVGYQHISELLEDVPHLIAIRVSRDLLQRLAVLRHRSHIAVVGKARSLRINHEAVGDQPVGVRHVELAAPVGLRYLVHDHVLILPPMEVRQQRHCRVAEEQDFSVQRCMLGMVDDVGDHPITGLTVDRTETVPPASGWRGRSRLADQENARLGEQNLLAQSRQTMGISHSSVRLRAATRPIYIMNNQMSTLQFKRKTREGWRTPRGFLHWSDAQSGYGLIADPMMTARH